MDAKKRKALEAAGWKFGDAADFLGMNDAERQILEARVELALAIRRQREVLNISQKQLGSMLKTSQPRVARIERAASDVSMDQLIRAFTVAGGRFVIRSAGKSFKPSTSLTLEVEARDSARSRPRRTRNAPRPRLKK
jgi:transcriptional regulator with XRE-family HTH domain